MTAKERRQMRKLEIRLEESEKMLDRINQSHMDQFRTIYEDRCAMLEAMELVSEAYGLIRGRVKGDPQYQAKKAEIEANF
ncbi:MAG TPA: hypothetical protein DDY86_03900 [Syntrophaceae bacterium]|nr:hypothetical protein [Syntrophaceae bacterium]